MGTQIATDDPEGKSQISRKLGLGPNRFIHSAPLSRNGSLKTESKGNRLYSADRVWPVVRFANGREVVCVPAEFDVASASGVTEATREQVRIQKIAEGCQC
jgi:hypothetical protein